MAPVIPTKITPFKTRAAFLAWMKKHHDTATEIWIRIYKKDSGIATITNAECLDVALCFGWIDAIRKSYDEQSYLQRYCPRRARSMWSQINREHVARLTAAGQMTPHGQHQIDAAKADGRWDAAYAPMSAATTDSIAADLRTAIEANPKALKTFRTLNKANLFSLIFRMSQVKTAAGRATKIKALVAMLARGETIAPQPALRKRRKSTTRAG